MPRSRIGIRRSKTRRPTAESRRRRDSLAIVSFVLSCDGRPLYFRKRNRRRRTLGSRLLRADDVVVKTAKTKFDESSRPQYGHPHSAKREAAAPPRQRRAAAGQRRLPASSALARAVGLRRRLRSGRLRVGARDRQRKQRRRLILLQRDLAAGDPAQNPSLMPLPPFQFHDLFGGLIEKNAKALALAGDRSPQREARTVRLDRRRRRMRENVRRGGNGGGRRTPRGGEDRPLARGRQLRERNRPQRVAAWGLIALPRSSGLGRGEVDLDGSRAGTG